MTSSKEMPEEIREQVLQFDTALNDIEQFIKPLFFKNFKETQNQLSPLQRAKLNLCLAYTINTLFYMFLKTKGISPQNHPVKKELARIQEYIKKIRAKQGEYNAKLRTFKVDKEATARFIQAALNGNSNEAAASVNTLINDDKENEESATQSLANNKSNDAKQGEQAEESEKSDKKSENKKRKRENQTQSANNNNAQKMKKRKSPK